ncbi:MAG TPA: benzoate-CoA ligase family protein [Candidatus Dormibacteraeota bacterium]|nr:benzoate-CoA ligase family protein [Candidatus Dormibacteraeota bacterium]
MATTIERQAAAPVVNVPDQFNAADYLVDRHVRDGRGGRTAILCGDESVTYAQVSERSNRVGNGLRSLGVRREERVLLLLLDTPAFAYSFFGAQKIGAVPIPTNTLLKSQDYRYMLNDSRATVAIVSEPLLPQLAAIPRNELPHLQHLVIDGRPTADAIGFEQLLAAAPALEPDKTSKDDAAFWLYSSGTTGFPKGAVHLHHDVVHTVVCYAQGVLGMTADDRTFSVAKLFFAYGLGNALTFPLAVGATTILWPGPPTPPNVYAQIERHKPTLFYSVPTNYGQLLAHKREGADFDLSSVRRAVSAGEALPKALYERFKDRFGVEILDGIGSTEILHIFISNRSGRVRPGSAGELVPGYEARIVDEGGDDVADGTVGNLLIKGDSICAYYWNKHDRTKDTIEGHWIRTGDKFSRDADGYYWYAGRADDMLKVGGIWVSPVEIENTLVEHPAVQEAGVIGRRDADDLEKPMAYVVLAAGRQGSEELARELQDFVRSKIAEYKRPRWIAFVEALPKTATGKTQRFKLRQAAASDAV